MVGLAEVLRVGRGAARLADIDSRSTPGLSVAEVGDDPKGWSAVRVAEVGQALAGYQERLYAAAKAGGARERVLLVLQAMDCGGKDGAVRAVGRVMNPAGLRIVSFGPPTDVERAHDFLWRIRAALPPPGYLGIFNRSHYEDVLVARVHGLVDEQVWSRRYDAINAFEAEQAADGVTWVKVMLHISPEEQRKRLLARLDDPTKWWKYNPGDLTERRSWAAYQHAYQDALRRCSTETAPWHVVPADRKWYRNWAVASLLHDALARLDPRYPEPDFDVAAERAKLTGT